MKTLKNENFFLGGEDFELGEMIAETEVIQVYDNYIPKIYYKDGIKEIDDFFSPNWYVKHKYICVLAASELAISLFFMKYNNDSLVDMGVAHINRKRILDYEKIENEQLEVIKLHEGRNYFKFVAKRKMGLTGLFGAAAADKIVPIDTEFVKGWEYKLNYLDKNDNKQQLTIYAANQHTPNINHVLYNYYKKVE